MSYPITRNNSISCLNTDQSMVAQSLPDFTSNRGLSVIRQRFQTITVAIGFKILIVSFLLFYQFIIQTEQHMLQQDSPPVVVVNILIMLFEILNQHVTVYVSLH